MSKPGAPPSNEHFLLKDLDTGMKSFVTDQEWVEKPVVPSVFLSSPSPLAQTATKKHAATDALAALHRSNPTGTIIPSKPPPHPQGQSGRYGRQVQKRARSDELHSSQAMLRPNDHVRVLSHKKRDRDRDFTNLYRWQHVRAHHGAIRVLEFNSSGKWLATAGADTFVKIWLVNCNLEENQFNGPNTSGKISDYSSLDDPPKSHTNPTYAYLRTGAPALTCRGHTSDVTDLAWSKNNFLLSASLDGTIRLWHPSSKTCLRRLLHGDMVTSVAFHPTDEQICISGTSDGILHMWHLRERKILSQTDTDDLITATAITPDGTTALVGTQHGRCKFYALFDEIQAEWQFKHTTQLDVRSRRARHASGKKVCGFRFYANGEKVLVSSNDSRLRLYRLSDKSVVCKFVGCHNSHARLNGSFDPTGRYVLCASEERKVYLWDVHVDAKCKPAEDTNRTTDYDDGSASSTAAAQQKDSGSAHESFVVQDFGQVTAAIFAPNCVPQEAMNLRAAFSNPRTCGLVIVTASDDGHLRVFGCC